MGKRVRKETGPGLLMAKHFRAWCLRHAESDNILAGAAGRLPSAALTPQGRKQAAAAARLLNTGDIAWTYTSVALRARETASYIVAGHPSALTQLPDLDEVGIGRSEGATDQATRDRTADVLHAWVVDQDLDQRVADGESGHEVVARITRAFDSIATAHPSETVLVVGHVASLTAGLSALCGLGGRLWGMPLPHALPFLIERYDDAWHCTGWPGLA